MTDGYYRLTFLKNFPAVNRNELASFVSTSFDSYITNSANVYFAMDAMHAFRLGDPIHVYKEDFEPYKVVAIIADNQLNQKYVLNVTNIEYVTNDHIVIHYEIDWLNTLVKMDAYGTIKFRNAFVSRASAEIFRDMDVPIFKPITPQATMDSKYGTLDSWSFNCLYRDSANDTIYFLTMTVSNEAYYPMLAITVLGGRWYSLLKFTLQPSDILVASIAPFTIETNENWEDVVIDNSITATAKRVAYATFPSYIMKSNEDIYLGNIISNPESLTTMKDMRGNVIWQATPYKNYTQVGNINYELAISMSSMSGRLIIDDETITIPCENVDIFTDAWAEYVYRQRDTDINLRQLNNDTAYKQQMVGSINNALGGAIGGAMTGNPVGAVAGAIGGALTGVVGGILNQQIATEAGIKEQNLIDMSYKKTNDTLSLVGNASVPILVNNQFGLYVTEWDDATFQNYERDIEINGIYVEYYTEDFTFESWKLFRNALKCDGTVYSIGGVAVSGAISADISNRFRDGVRVVRV